MSTDGVTVEWVALFERKGMGSEMCGVLMGERVNA